LIIIEKKKNFLNEILYFIFIEINNKHIKYNDNIIRIYSWYLFAIEIIDTQVARRGRLATHPTKKKNKIRLVKENKKNKAKTRRKINVLGTTCKKKLKKIIK
jgi:hypothetical protein